MDANPRNVETLVNVLQEARMFLARPTNDFAWSTWDDAAEALREVDGLIAKLHSGQLPKRDELEILFLPTGPIQEVSVSSGWGEQFLDLANNFDHAMRTLYGPHPRERAPFQPELNDYIRQLFSDGMRWFCTVMATIATGYLFYLRHTTEPVEVYFPLHLKGDGVFYAMLLGAVVFGILALLNWVVWFRKRRR